MKCINCGAEIKSEFKNCPYCGSAIQIVPDYSVYDEDNIDKTLMCLKEYLKLLVILFLLSLHCRVLNFI